MANKSRKILVHTCCAACASHVYSQLKKDGFKVIGFFFHPEIDSDDEYGQRLVDLKKYCLENDFELIEGEYDSKDFWSQIEPYKDPKSMKYINDKDRYRRRRCQACNMTAMQKSAEQTKKLRLKYFTTTLLCSPYKDHEQIIELGNEKSLDYGLNFYYQDFRKGYWMGRNFARNHQVYIPKFCGCLESLKEKRLE